MKVSSRRVNRTERPKKGMKAFTHTELNAVSKTPYQGSFFAKQCSKVHTKCIQTHYKGSTKSTQSHYKLTTFLARGQVLTYLTFRHIACFTLLLFGFQSHAAERPNVILIIADDQGWGDYGFMGHPIIETPHLDRLAETGIVFT